MNKIAVLTIVATLTLANVKNSQVFGKPNSIPRSTNSRSIDPKHFNENNENGDNNRNSDDINEESSSTNRRRRDGLPPWNLSPKIDPDGFLTERFDRVHGEWEMDPAGSADEYGRYFDMQESVYVRQVPGDGNCLFHSITVALALVSNRTHVDMSFVRDHENEEETKQSMDRDSMLDSNDSLHQKAHNTKHINHSNRSRIHRDSRLVCRYTYTHDLYHLHHHSRHLRNKAVEMLSQNPRKLLFLQGNEYLRARDLVSAAAAQYNLSAEEYCEQMKKDSVWGGGPEIVGLCNYLRRPIHVYELSDCCDNDVDMEVEDIDGGDISAGENKGESDSEFATLSIRRRQNLNRDRLTKPPSLPKSQQFHLRRMACFGSPKFDQREPLHILSADSRFPDIEPGKQLSSGNHFLALFPEGVIAAVMEEQERRARELERIKRKKVKVRGKSLRGGSANSLVDNSDDPSLISRPHDSNADYKKEPPSTLLHSQSGSDADVNLNMNNRYGGLAQTQSSNRNMIYDEFWQSGILPYAWSFLHQIKSFLFFLIFNRP